MKRAVQESSREEARRARLPELLEIRSWIRETEARAGALRRRRPAERLAFMNLRFYRTGTIARPRSIRRTSRTSFACSAAQAGPDLRRRRVVRPARAPRTWPTASTKRSGACVPRTQFESGSIAAPGKNGNRTRRARRAVEPSDLSEKRTRSSAINRKRTAPCSPAQRQARILKRAEDRNRNTAKTYDQLGLPEFYAP